MSRFQRSLFLSLGIGTFLGYWDLSWPALAGEHGLSDAETITCERDHNSLLIPVTIAGKRCLMLFDTGADNITISRKDLSALGVLLPLDGIRGSVRGVGKPLSSTLKSSATVKVGNYLRENFPINIQEDSFLQPVIGINFFQNCLVTVDVDHSRIVLSSESQVSGGTASTSSGVSHAVTVSFSGNQLLVPVTVNGCATSMLLDSGADCITFSQEQAAAMHLVVPADARPEVHMGVGGAVKGVGFTLSECAVGPLSKQNVKVSVIESPGMPYPLMGAEFLKDCIYTINKEHSQITFERI